MAKESMKARERKRAKIVAKYAEKRKALKAAGDYEALQKLPKNASPVRMHNRCKLNWTSKRVYETIWCISCNVSRNGKPRFNTRR